MKNFALGIVLTVVVLGTISYVGAAVDVGNEGPNPSEELVIVGDVIELANYAMYGRVGAEHADAMKYRAEHGFPVGIIDDESGDVFIAIYRLPVPAAGMQTANAILQPFLGQKVVCQGRVWRAKGLNLIRISVVSEY